MRGIDHNKDFGWSNIPRKGGGGSSGGSTTTQQSGPPAQVLKNYQEVYDQAKNVAQQPYQTYDASMVAGFTPQQQAGFNNINTAANAAQPFLNQASQYATNAAGTFDPSTFQSTTGQYKNPNLDPYLGYAGQAIGSAQGVTQDVYHNLTGANFGKTVQDYYNPYAEGVIKPTQALFNQQNAEGLNQVRGNAAAAGAFGGDREAVAEAQTARQQQLAQAPVLAQLQSTGYNQAVQNAFGAAGQGQQTAGNLLNSAQQTANLGGLTQQNWNAATGANRENAALQGQAGNTMANLGQLSQTLGLQGAQAQIGAGGQQQQLAQQELNVPYQQWQQAQAYPFQTTNWLEGMATGTGGMSGTQGSTTQPGPSTGSQIAGAGLAGASLIGATGGFGSNGWLTNMFGGGGGGGYADSGGWQTARGGRIPGFARGGEVPWAPKFASQDEIPDFSINFIPQPMQGQGKTMLGPNVETSTTTGGGGGGGGVGGAIGTLGSLAGIARLGVMAFSDRRLKEDIARVGTLHDGTPIHRYRYKGDPEWRIGFIHDQIEPHQPHAVGQISGFGTVDPKAATDRSAISERNRGGWIGDGQLRALRSLRGIEIPRASAPGGFASGGEAGDDDDLPIGFDSLAPWMRRPRASREIPDYQRGAWQRSDDAPPDEIEQRLTAGMAAPNIGPFTSENTSDWRADAPALGQTAGFAPSETAARAPEPYPGDAGGDEGGSTLSGPFPGLSQTPSGRQAQAEVSAGNITQQQADDYLRDRAAVDRGQQGQQGQQAGEHRDFLSGPWGTLLASGLAIMGGDSPHAAVNIGRGGFQGLQFGEHQRLREEQQQLRMQQAADLAQYRRDMSGAAAQRAEVYGRRADTYDRSVEAKARYNDLMAQVHAGNLTQRQAHDAFMREFHGQEIELRRQGFDFQRDKAAVGQAQRQLGLDQANLRIANSQANAQEAREIRRQALAQTADLAGKRAIQTATNTDIHAAAQLAAGLGIPYLKALKQVQTGRGSAEEGQGVPAGTTTGTAPTGNRPPLSSIFGQ